MAQSPSSPKIGALSPALPAPSHRPQGALEGVSFTAALQLGARQRTAGTTVGLLGALLFHSALGLPAAMSSFQAAQFAREVLAETRARTNATLDIDSAPEPPPPPPPPEPAPPEPAENKPAPPPAANHAAPPPPPAAAQAGQVLAAAPDPDEPLDLTGNTFVVGNAATYAGGITASNGTSKSAVHDQAASPTGVVGGTGPKAAAVYSGPDLSRGAAVTSTDWGQVPFPPEADVEQINFMRVTVVVQVGADGHPNSVTVLSDPGFGFGRAARQFALQHTYNSALDRSGKPITQSLTVTIKFQR